MDGETRTETVTLDARMPSLAADQLIERLAQVKAGSVHLDGLQVRTMGARVAEVLCRFKRAHKAAGGTLTCAASPDLHDDLRILGLDHLLLGKDL
ncbi:STAS domain-containing protein [Palleronia salina]|uniref:STAS domain-containing protein n=1 Tax=Palleronia salina TaxID=313368 RepID=A0A1M6HUG5_9RHOB|nr:STAS domain-containing protein [Palleronia salina]SHJ25835.1 STAS domain-containing protein [Palleronia salina]